MSDVRHSPFDPHDECGCGGVMTTRDETGGERSRGCRCGQRVRLAKIFWCTRDAAVVWRDKELRAPPGRTVPPSRERARKIVQPSHPVQSQGSRACGVSG